MCLAVPAQIVELRAGDEATVDLHGSRIAISTVLVPEVVLGDWVLVHAGFALERLDPAVVQSTFAVLSDLATAEASTSGPNDGRIANSTKENRA